MNDMLLEFVFERESIRLKREAGAPAPWTKDLVLQKYKFTNIRRKDDRVSKWIIDHLIAPQADAPDLWFTLFLARLINWPPTLQRLIDAKVLPTYAEGFNAAGFIKVVEDAKTHGKVYSGAYMVFPTKNKGRGKAEAMCEHIISDVIKRAPLIRMALRAGRIEGFVHEMSKCFGVSTFIAGQVAADLTYMRRQLGRAPDLHTFAPLGPGSQRGLNYVYGFKPYHTWNQDSFNAALIKIRAEIVDKLSITDLTLHDVQNCLCEYSKYCKVIFNEGAPRTLYKPETEF